MKTLGIIPARFGSSRFPGKPLIDILGKPMVIRVYDNALQSQMLDEVIIATDDERILEVAKKWNANARMTAASHQSGTDRCAEIAAIMNQYDYVLNIQGDEPFVNPIEIDEFLKFIKNHQPDIASLKAPLFSLDDIHNTSVVKVVCDRDQNALYFSRAPIPFNNSGQANYFKHLGLYAFKLPILLKLSKLQPGFLEQTESLEQLRWLENGYKIMLMTTNQESFAIDTPEDLEKIKNIYHDTEL
jgi:3-deoxy-manno-octulosonate cytidylyltransferase (CMP-KDO synthetase)